MASFTNDMAPIAESRIIKWIKSLGIGGLIAFLTLTFEVSKSGFNEFEQINKALILQVEINKNMQTQISELKAQHSADFQELKNKDMQQDASILRIDNTLLSEK